jgi:hypothetical protein
MYSRASREKWKLSDSYRKLTKPFESRRNAGIQSKNNGSVKKIERIKTIDEKISIALKTSPPRIKSPFRKSKPAQNKIILTFISKPKMRSKKARAESKSIEPRAFRASMKNHEAESL